MKKFFLLGISALLCMMLLSKCSQKEESAAITTYEYLDFDIDNSDINIRQYYVRIAAERMNKYLTYKDGQFVLSLDDPSVVGLSHRVFDFMVELMNSQNEIIQNIELIEVSPNVLVPVNEYSLNATREPGGVNKWEMKFAGFLIYTDIYISNRTLRDIAAGEASIALLAALAIEPSTATKIAAAICGLASIITDRMANAYPNGIIISLITIAPIVPCIPYDLTSQ